MRLLPIVSIALVVVPAAHAGDWPEFRGPTGDGHVAPAGLPLHWSETNNIKWKTAIPYKGLSTPVIMGRQVWLTSATEDGHDFFAICVEMAVHDAGHYNNSSGAAQRAALCVPSSSQNSSRKQALGPSITR